MTEAVRCACLKGCECTVLPGQGVTVDGKVYCSQACATGHAQGEGCGSSTCHCGA